MRIGSCWSCSLLYPLSLENREQCPIHRRHLINIKYWVNYILLLYSKTFFSWQTDLKGKARYLPHIHTCYRILDLASEGLGLGQHSYSLYQILQLILIFALDSDFISILQPLKMTYTNCLHIFFQQCLKLNRYTRILWETAVNKIFLEHSSTSKSVFNECFNVFSLYNVTKEIFFSGFK